MTSHQRFGITLLLSLASLLPATVGAQPPVYLNQWGTPGGGDGQFHNRLDTTPASIPIRDSERGNVSGCPTLIQNEPYCSAPHERGA